jgi:inosose dehydratase
MKLGYCAITWGGVVGTAQGVGSVADLFYATAGGRTEEAVRDIASVGYRGVELFDGDLLRYEDDPDALLAVLEHNRVDLASVYTGANFVYPDIAEDEFTKLSHSADLARRFGAARLVVGGGAKRTGGAHADDIEALGRALDRVCDLAASKGLEAGYHPHLGTLVETEDALERLFANCSIPFCPDTAHLAAGGADPAALIRRHGDRLSHIHLKDLQREPLKFLPLGTGEVDLDAVMAAIRGTGYDGWLMVELDAYDGNPREAAERSKGWFEARGLWT